MNWYKTSQVDIMFKEAIRALSNEQKILIKKTIQDNPGSTQMDISKLTKIPANYIRAYFHLNGHNSTNKKKSKVRNTLSRNKDIISKVMPLHESGMSPAGIARELVMPYSSVSRIIAYNRKLNSTEDYIPILKHMIWDGLGIGFSDIIEGNNDDYQRLKYIGQMIDRQFGNSQDKHHARQALMEKLNLRGNFINMLQSPGIDAGYGSNDGDSMVHHFDENPIKSPNTVLNRQKAVIDEDSIANMLLDGKSIEVVSNTFNITKGYVSKIISERGIQYSPKGWSEETKKRRSEQQKAVMEERRNDPAYKKKLSDAAKAKWERIRQEKAKQTPQVPQVPMVQNSPISNPENSSERSNQDKIRQLRELQERLRKIDYSYR